MNKFKLLFNIIHSFTRVKLATLGLNQNFTTITKKWYTPSKPLEKSKKPVLTWIGQSTFLIQIAGINILTDPIFFQPSRLFPRLLPPGIDPCDLPKIDIIIISHNHKDHMDERSIMLLKKQQPTILVPHGIGDWFTKRGFINIAEMHWEQQKTLQGITFTFLPAKHWSGRSWRSINKGGHGSWMIQSNEYTIYFAGDSSYGSHFTETANLFPKIDVTLLPISPIEPRKLIAHAHLDPAQAIQAFLDLKAQTFIPMHWGTFQMGAEYFEQPILELEQVWQNRKSYLKNKQLIIQTFGSPITLD